MIKNILNQIKEEKESKLKSKQSRIKENARIKAKINTNNVKSEEEIKENYKLIAELRNIYSILNALMRQHNKMKKNNINFFQYILNDLRKINNTKSILSNLNSEVN